MSEEALAAIGKALVAIDEKLDAHVYLLAITVTVAEEQHPNLRNHVIDALNRLLGKTGPSPENEPRLSSIRRFRDLQSTPAPLLLH